MLLRRSYSCSDIRLAIPPTDPRLFVAWEKLEFGFDPWRVANDGFRARRLRGRWRRYWLNSLLLPFTVDSHLLEPCEVSESWFDLKMRLSSKEFLLVGRRCELAEDLSQSEPDLRSCSWGDDDFHRLYRELVMGRFLPMPLRRWREWVFKETVNRRDRGFTAEYSQRTIDLVVEVMLARFPYEMSDFVSEW